jgi:hypothetical protein
VRSSVVRDSKSDDLGVRGAARRKHPLGHRAQRSFKWDLERFGKGIPKQGDAKRFARSVLGAGGSAKPVLIDLDVCCCRRADTIRERWVGERGQ